MTKLKNTKKGMAKKALSISLVAAMLATSNVPVWAAEDIFSSQDNAAVEAEAPVDDVDVFSSEEASATDDVALAAVVEEAEAGVELQAAADYKVDTNMELKDGDWGTNLVLGKKETAPASDAEKFVITDKNTLPAVISKVEIYSGDNLLNSVAVNSKELSGLKSAINSVYVGLDAYKNSKQVTVKIYVENENEAICEFSAAVKAVDISEWDVTTTKDSEEYNGKIQSPEVSVTNSPAYSAPASVVVKFDDAKEARNVGTYTYKVEGVEADGYTGTAEATGTFEITVATPDEDNLSVVISGDTVYNGSATAPKVVVTDKLTNTVIPEELYTVTVPAAKQNVGSYTKNDITVTLKNKEKVGTDTEYTLNNFAAVAVPADCISGEFKVNALDLSKLNDNYTITVDAQTVNTAISDSTWAGVTFTDKKTQKSYSGKTAISAILPVSQLTLVTSNNTAVGTGKIIIRPTSATETNIINEFSTTFSVVGSIIDKNAVSFAAGTKIDGVTPLLAKSSLQKQEDAVLAELRKAVYTGSAVEPLKEAFSNLVLSNSATITDQKLVLGTDYDLVYTDNIDSKEVSGKTSTVTLKFKGNYAGIIPYTFVIAQADAYVEGTDVPYTPGKNSYDVSAKVYTKDGSKEVAVPEKEYTVTTTRKATEIYDTTKNNQSGIAAGVVVFENKNYMINGGNKNDNKTEDGRWYKQITSHVTAKKLSDCTATVEGTYVYTGDAINPKLVVKDGNTVLVEGKDYFIASKTGTNAGPAHVTVQGMGNYTGTLTADYTIAKANLSSVVVLNTAGKKNYDKPYSGVVQGPDIDVVNGVKIGNAKLTEYNPITKKGDFKLTWDEDAIDVGTYNFTITAMPSSEKVEGEYKGTFKITPNELRGFFATKLGLNEVDGTLGVDATGAYYTGKEITIDKFKTKYVLVKEGTSTVLTEGKDYRLVYENNIDSGIATVTAYGLGNFASVDPETGKENPVGSMSYAIEGIGNIIQGWVKKVNDVEYAGGLPVEPEVIVMNGNTRLVQGKDYTVETSVTDIKANNGTYAGTEVRIKGKGAYTADANLTAAAGTTWKVVKKDLANTVITVSGETVTVMNGTVIVPASEYDVKFSEDGKKVTVTAKADSKNYTGSQEKDTDSKAVGTPVIKEVKVTNNKANIILSGDVDNAIGYDYVVSTVEDYKNGRVAFDKNQVATQSTIQYLQKGEYYAYLHAWKRVDGKKVFGGWSNIVKFTVTTTTPDQPLVTSVTRSGSTVKVTYTKTKNATGYDIVLGSKTKKVNGELRPVEYGKLVKKITKGNVVTATFKNVPKGTYYAGLHAYNRTSVNNSKVFSPWSNSKKVVVK